MLMKKQFQDEKKVAALITVLSVQKVMLKGVQQHLNALNVQRNRFRAKVSSNYPKRFEQFKKKMASSANANAELANV